MKFNLFLPALLISAFALGCNYLGSSTNSNSANKSLLDRAEETVFGTEKTGIPECDAVLAKLESQNTAANESLLDAGKRIAIKQAILATIREKTGSANLSPQDKVFYGKRCQEIYQQMTSASPTPAKK